MNPLSKLRHLASSQAVIWRAVQMVRSFAGSWMLMLGILTVLGGLVPLVNVFLTREIVDGFAGLSNLSAAQTSRVFWLIGALVIMMLLSELIDALSQWIRMGYSEIVADEVQARIHDVAIEADYQYFEIPQYYDQLFLATSGAEDELTTTVDNLFTLVRTSITLSAMIVVIAGFSLWLPVALIGASLPTLWLVALQSKKLHRLRKELIPHERRASYFDWLIQNEDAAAELRLYRLGEFFKARYRKLRTIVRERMLDLEKHHMVHRLAARLFGLAIMGGAMLLIVLRALSGQFSLGDVAMFYRTLKYSQDVGLEFVKGLGDLHQNSVFLTDFFQLLDTDYSPKSPEKPQSFPRPLREAIEFRQVQFTYPATETPVLQNLNLRIPAGKTTAILGPNGSGKSTILKLLSGLYSDYQGEIRLDQTERRHIDQAELRKNISVLFQDPMEYHLSMAENIAGPELQSPEAQSRIDAAAQAAGATELVNRLPNGANSNLGKWLHEGVELSGGEWHRVATARALFGDKPVLVMDEPTSALDPWAEAAWLQRIRKHRPHQTLIIITHRVSVARLADLICVMERGQVAEQGSHNELLKQQGAYAQIYADVPSVST